MAMKMTEMGVSDPAAASRKVLQSLLMRDAATLAYGDAFTALAICCFFAAFGALFVRPAPNMFVAQPVEDH
jgi:DHA2 family multidrug resistance protein